MSCGRTWEQAARRAEVERVKQQQRAMWTAALTGAVSGAVNGARGGATAQVRIGDAERESAVAALGDHYVAGRLTKDELDERTDTAWSARTSGELTPLFSDLPALPPPVPPRPPRRQRQPSFRMGARLSWVLVLLVVLTVTSHVPWFAVMLFLALWWGGVFRGLHHWTHRRP